jgi:hypothetical protein
MRGRRAVETVMIGLALIFFTGSAEARAKAARYRSHHPLPKHIGGYCYIEVPHTHGFGPHDRRVYRTMEGELYFVGDPVPYGYEGPRHSYFGGHPVVDVTVSGSVPIYCYLDGAHYHHYEPPSSAQFQVHGGAYFYVGAYDPVYQREKSRYVIVNDVYRPMAYTRPVVDIAVVPPEVHARVMVVGPAVRGRGRAVVAAPAPSVGLHVGVGISVGGPVVRERVIVHEPVHHHHHKVKHRKVKYHKVKHHKVKHYKVKR